jgi:hypothetical protein
MNNQTTIEIHKGQRDNFRRMKSLLTCVLTDPTREVIRYVSVEKDGDGILVIGTDGRRLRTDRFEINADAGLYEIKANTAQTIYLTKSELGLNFPNWKQIVPSTDECDAYVFKGHGKRFVLWVTAGLGCYIDPELIALHDEEDVTLYVQKLRPDLAPAVMQNETTTFVVMPYRVTEKWGQDLESIRNAKAA